MSDIKWKAFEALPSEIEAGILEKHIGHQVLVVHERVVECAELYTAFGAFGFEQDDVDIYGTVTHWSPMPEPPNA